VEYNTVLPYLLRLAQSYIIFYCLSEGFLLQPRLRHYVLIWVYISSTRLHQLLFK